MTLNDFCLQLQNDRDFCWKSRLLVIPNDDDRVNLKKILCARPDFAFVRISQIIDSNVFLPSPAILFSRIGPEIRALNGQGKIAFVTGLEAFMMLWDAASIQTAYGQLRNLVDGRELAVLFITPSLQPDVARVFLHPRYEEGLSVCKIGVDPSLTECLSKKIRFVDTGLCQKLPGTTISSLQEFVEEYENGSINFPEAGLNITFSFQGRALPGVNAQIVQIYSKETYLRQLCGLSDPFPPSEIEWVFEREINAEQLISVVKLVQETFVMNDILRFAPMKMRAAEPIERGVFLWMLKKSVSKDTYLGQVLSDENLTQENFIAYYVGKAQTLLGQPDARKWAIERRAAIEAIGASLLISEIVAFIEATKKESFERVAIWLNNGTKEERTEIIRRAMLFEADPLPKAALDSYPLLNDYLGCYSFGFDSINEYFSNYRQLKLHDTVTESFCTKAADSGIIPLEINSRDESLKAYATDPDARLLVVDALGIEYMPLMISLADRMRLGIGHAVIARAKIPSSTRFNPIDWPMDKLLPPVKALDSRIHAGAEKGVLHKTEENFFALLAVFEEVIMPSIATALGKFRKVIVTSDHGASRLALLAYEKGLAKTITLPDSDQVEDWRYAKAISGMPVPEDVVQTLMGDYWVIKGYNRFNKKGGKLNEMHGGSTPEEILVPIFVFAKDVAYYPPIRNGNKGVAAGAQFVENADFDL